MAQREEEEAKLRRLCVNNCGFPGNSATNNMCQACFQLQTAAAAAASASPPPRSCSPRSAPPPPPPPARAPAPVKHPEEGDPKGKAAAVAAAALAQAPERPASRCFLCRKRLGLMGFRCRCGELFCGQHRYSDRHECSFDYKTAARAAIARDNPVVRAAKIVRV